MKEFLSDQPFRIPGTLLLLVLAASLVVYKSAGAVRQVEHVRASGFVALKADVVSADSAALPLRVAAQSLNYVAAIWPALVFGILISGAVRAFTPITALSCLFDADRSVVRSSPERPVRR